MKKIVPNALRGVERTSTEMRATVVKTASGAKTLMLPADPVKAAAILAERRSKPAAKTRAKLAAEAAKRGV